MSLAGGLGNQLFQFACGLSLAYEHQLRISLDTSFFSSRNDATPREFALEPYLSSNFVLQSGLPVSVGSLSLVNPVRQVSRRLTRLFEVTLKEGTASPSRIIAKSRALNFSLEGYWQSEQFFRPVETQIKKLFTSPFPEVAEIPLVSEIRGDGNAVCVQVRRGDYAANPKILEKHGVMSPAYFQRALAHLHRQRHVSQVFVFTDDKDWASKHLQLPHNTRIVSLPSEFDTPVVNLLALSQGHRFVISNSTFGWWGAWLSDSPGTSVVAPRRWFRDLSRDGSLLVPDSWVTL